mgnify:CR=1 FL=1
MTAPSPAALPARRHDLDWLRAIAILALLFFHSAMPYAAESGWHIRNAQESELLLELNFFVSRFRMALLFLIAGIAATFVLRRRGPLQFLRDRAKRLLVPLAFGIVVIVPPQIWYERLDTGATTLDFWAWWPSVFTTGTYPQGNFSYHHLWFIFYLFIYGVLLLPAMAWARTPRGAAALERARGWIAAHGVHWLAVPIVTTYALLVQWYPGQQDIVHDVAMFLTYFGYFAAGWVLGTHEGAWARLVAGRHRAFTGAVACLIVINQVRWNDLDPAAGWSPVRIAWLALLGLNAWLWVVTLLGYGRTWLTRENALLRWAREASYPFYIIHQTVIVAVAYYVVRTDDTVMAKFTFTWLVSLVVTLALYEAFVRPYRPMRWLFGMPAVSGDRS